MTDTVAGLLEARFVDRADAIAVRGGDAQLSYRELDRATRARAAWLDHHGVPPRATVGLTLERSVDQVAWVVAIVRSGRALCFLDRAHPTAWNLDVCARAGIAYAVGPAIDELALAWIAAAPACPPVFAPPEVAPGDRVYVNFSSGTTGAPKVIPCLHRGVVGFCHAPRHLPFARDTRLIYSSPLTFDASQLELWCALLNGGCIVVNDQRYLTATALRALVRDGGANALWLTSSLFNALVDADPQAFAGIRALVVGGEAVSPRHVAQVYAACPSLAVFNGYGPTETTIIACVYPIPRDAPADAPLPIGWPIAQARCWIVRDDGRDAADGEIGELWIAGDGLSPEYLGDPALTRARYVMRGDERCYRTGDLASRDGAGAICYHGRLDDQVKIRGNRVVPSEVARAYAAHPRVRDCAVLARTTTGATSLALFYVADGLAVDELVAFGRARLPAFMQPREVIAVPALPLRANGKVDRERLLAIEHARALPDDDDPRATLVRGFAGLPSWDMAAGLFEAGGDSLAAIRLVGALERVAPGAISLEALYAAPRLRDVLARLPPVLAAPRREAAAAPPAIVPLAPAQLTMWYPELLGDETRNNVVYVFARDFGDGIDRAALRAELVRRFPLLGAVVVEDDAGYGFMAGGEGVEVIDDVRYFDSIDACAQHWLQHPLPLRAGPLLAIWCCRIAGRRHHGVVLHHVLGDHIGQLALLRAIEALLARNGRASLGEPDVAYVADNLSAWARVDADRDRCEAAWRARRLVGTPLASLAPDARPRAMHHRCPGLARDRAPSQLQLACLAAARAGFCAAFGIREPLVFALFSLRESAAGLGFHTVLAPVALRDALFEAPDALLGALLATRRDASIGMEEILVAAGLGAGDAPFLFNFVELALDDHRWIAEHLVDAGHEPARTTLDVTVMRSGPLLDVVLNGTYTLAQAEAFWRAFRAVVASHVA